MEREPVTSWVTNDGEKGAMKSEKSGVSFVSASIGEINPGLAEVGSRMRMWLAILAANFQWDSSFLPCSRKAATRVCQTSQ